MITLYFMHLWNSFSAWAIGWGGLAALVGVVLIAIWFISPQWLSSAEARAVLLNFGLGCLAFAFVSGYYTKVGYNTCVDAVAKGDQRVIERMRTGQQAIDACRAKGWTWDVTTGECQ